MKLSTVLDACNSALEGQSVPSSAEIESADGRRHLTMLPKIVAGNWQMLYQHVG